MRPARDLRHRHGRRPEQPGQLRTIVSGRHGTAASSSGARPALICKGIFQAPYYLTAAANTGSFGGLTNDPAPLINKWQALAPRRRHGAQPHAPQPAADLHELQQVPVLISVPDSCIPMPGAGYPVVIFQHGISGNGRRCSSSPRPSPAGFACVAIDLPLHGVTQGETLPDGTTLFLGYNQAGDVWERTFGIDLLTTQPAAAPTGPRQLRRHFINLADLAVSRDNLRQGAADLFNARLLNDLTVLGMDVIDETGPLHGPLPRRDARAPPSANQTPTATTSRCRLFDPLPAERLLPSDRWSRPKPRASGVLSGTPD